MALARGLTELEGAVLGTIRQKGPCTTYAVRREFRTSTTPYWSGSAGAIYPAVARLARRRLVRPTRHAADGRGGVRYVVTAAGERALRRWLGPPFSPLVVGPPPDPIRTRVNFLGLLPAADRAAFLAAAAEAIAAGLAALAAAPDKAGLDECERLALRGSLRTMEARLAWVREGLSSAGGSESR
jgi:DNA-binding PadR family transcriptional regulator